MWCLYKEVQDFYREGLRVPDDVTLLWADDNWGNIRRLPTAEERKRSGGAGIYYHFDYHGGPRSYQWLNTSPIAKVWDQLSLAKQYGADRIWIVNVGHFKGYEFPMEFFMRFAWDTTRWTNENLDEYTRQWAEREFGAKYAEQIAQIIIGYTNYNGRRKPELLDAGTYSLVNYGEFEKVVSDYRELTAKAERISSELPLDVRNAFYELVLFPVKACAQLNALYLAAARNDWYARQGHASANAFAAQTRDIFNAQTNLMDHFNREFAGGKWNHFMDQSYIGYTGWRDPERNNLDAIKLTELKVPDTAAAGIAIEGVEDALASKSLKLDTFNPSEPDRASLEGFVESEGCVSIEAEHYTRNVQAGPNRWIRIPNYGHTLSGMRADGPVDTRATPGKDSPCLEYKMYLFHTGNLTVDASIGATLNFMPGRALRCAISFDDEPPQAVTAVPVDFNAKNGNLNWEESVKNNGRHLTATRSISAAGYHTLKIWMLDPALILEKIVVNTGGVRASYLGPRESFHSDNKL
jgi:hypothetical protein